ncbi:MAG TPA: DUF5666 domain-containing protein, partial [Ktedonobacterales bacterium]
DANAQEQPYLEAPLQSAPGQHTSYQVAPYQAPPSYWPPRADQTPTPGGRRWLLIGGIALAFALTLALGAFLGATLHSTANAASFSPGARNAPELGNAPFGPGGRGIGLASTPGAQGQPGAPGQCDALSVTSVSADTIVASRQDGTSVTIHTSSNTAYTKNRQSATASAVTVGSHIHVQGTTNSDGSITATSIDVQ